MLYSFTLHPGHITQTCTQPYGFDFVSILLEYRSDWTGWGDRNTYYRCELKIVAKIIIIMIGLRDDL